MGPHERRLTRWLKKNWVCGKCSFFRQSGLIGLCTNPDREANGESGFTTAATPMCGNDYRAPFLGIEIEARELGLMAQIELGPDGDDYENGEDDCN